MKKILYIDMDNVIVDFRSGLDNKRLIISHHKELLDGEKKTELKIKNYED